MTAMTAATLDRLSGGRFRLGLGVSGPQVSEGWHGVRFDKPLARTREYVAIVNAAMRRETVVFEGEHFTLPLPDGPGKALKLSIRPVRDHVPVYLAAVGPKNLELAGEIADGWLGILNDPAYLGEQLNHIKAGRAKPVRTAWGLDGFDVVAPVPVWPVTTWPPRAEPIRGYTALYIGGMGSREKNFYNALAVRMGYAKEAKEIQDLYLDKQHREAMAAVPQAFIDSHLAARWQGADRRQAHGVRRGRGDHGRADPVRADRGPADRRLCARSPRPSSSPGSVTDR